MTEATGDAIAGNRLEHFPITFFAIVMGLLGLTLALRASAPCWGGPKRWPRSWSGWPSV